MLEFRRGDLFQCGADALVNPVNCVGVMGRGLAKQFRDRFPENYREYHAACNSGALVPGRLLVTERDGMPRYIVNLPTKRHWRDQSRPQDVASGLVKLAEFIAEHPGITVAVPALGAGLGRLSWREVRPLIESMLAEAAENSTILVFEPLNNSGVALI